MNTIKIQVGNDVKLRIRPTYQDKTPISTSSLTKVAVYVGTEGHYAPVSSSIPNAEWIEFTIPSSYVVGKYNVRLIAVMAGSNLQCTYENLFEIVPYGNDINYAEYVTDFVMVGMSSAQVNALVNELNDLIEYYNQRLEDIAAAPEQFADLVSMLQELVNNISNVATKDDVQTILTALSVTEAEVTNLLTELDNQASSTTNLSTEQDSASTNPSTYSDNEQPCKEHNDSHPQMGDRQTNRNPCGYCWCPQRSRFRRIQSQCSAIISQCRRLVRRKRSINCRLSRIRCRKRSIYRQFRILRRRKRSQRS